MALVVVGHGGGTARLQGQAGLGAIKSLNLALLVHGEHHGMGRWINIEPDHIFQPLGKLRVARELEGADAMRLEPVRGPDALHRAQAHAGSFGHHPPGPLRGFAGRLGQR